MIILIKLLTINNSLIDFYLQIFHKHCFFLLLQLIEEKELIKTTLELSIRIHSTLLKERINHLKIRLHRNLVETLDQVSEEAFVRQSEFARNIVIFCNKQKYLIDKLFSKNNIFEQYFGYIQSMH